jgi:ethanolamine utilization protein EutA (predicted chaperonin)
MNSKQKRQIKIDRQKRKVTELHKELQFLYDNNGGKMEISKLKSELNQATSRLQNLRTQLNITITDHALIRYIERTLGVDLCQIKESMKTYCVNNDHPLLHFEIKDNVVVTVLQKK